MTIPVFINDRKLEVAPGTSALAAAAASDPAVGAALAEGRAYLTDGRGIRCDPTTPLSPGAILRIVTTARRNVEVEEPDAHP